MGIEADLLKASPGSLVELYVLDATAQGDTSVRYYHAGTNSLSAPVVWQGNTYTPIPMQIEGFEWSGTGPLPRPMVRIANIGGTLGSLVRQYQDLVGAKVIRKRTFVKYLDAVNFGAGNATADPNAYVPDEAYFVARKAAENKIYIDLELTPAWDVTGVKLPRRQVIANVCPWKYRGAECGYAGGPVADVNDTLTANPLLDQCGKRLASCKLRFGANNELPFGGFPGAGLYR